MKFLHIYYFNKKFFHQQNTDLNICSAITSMVEIILAVKFLNLEFQADLQYSFLELYKF